MDPMEAIKQTFFQECGEQLAELEAGLLALDGGDRGPEIVNAVFRAVHSIKGGAGAFGLDDLVRFAHAFETALDALRSNRLSPEPSLIRVFLRAADLLADLVRQARGGATIAPGRSLALEAELAAFTSEPLDSDAGWDALLDFQPVRVDTSAAETWRVRFRPHASLYANGNDPVVLLRELARLGAARTTLDASLLPTLEELNPEASYLAWTVELTTAQTESDIREVFDFVDADCALEIGVAAPAHVEAAAPPASAPPPAAPLPEPVKPPATIRIDLNRLDRLIDLVGELVINQAVLAQRATELGFSRSSHVSAGLEDLEQLTREIQDGVMAIRAQPVKSVFQRLPRLAREAAALTGKDVKLVMEGEATEVDNTVVERLSDPLTHMIRNAIDHGIEPP